MDGFDLNDPTQVDRLWHELQSHVRQRVDHVHDAEDVVQETWLRALRQPIPPRAWNRWFERVAKRLVHEIHRSERSRAHRERAVARREFDIHREHDERLALLIQWVRELPPPYGPVVAMRYLEGREIVEIARRQGKCCGTVRSQLKRGLDKLKSRTRVRESGPAESDLSATLEWLALTY